MHIQFLWRGRDAEGIACFIAKEQWEVHVAKRIEIADALELTIRAMVSPDLIQEDKNRPDERSRYFRILIVSAHEKHPGYDLHVSVKYVRQPTGAWFKFYQSCWFQRSK